MAGPLHGREVWARRRGVRGVGVVWCLRVWLWVLAVACAGIVCGVSAGAQGLMGAEVRGRVLDARGLPLAGAAVRLISDETGAELWAVADARGRFGVLALEPGTYRMAVRPALVPVWVGALPVELATGEVRETDVEVGGGSAGGVRVVAGEAAGVSSGTGDELVSDEEEALVPGVRETALAGGGSAQDPDEGGESASGREEARRGGVRADGMPVDDGTGPMDAGGESSERQAFGGGVAAGLNGYGGGGPGFGAGRRMGTAFRAGNALRLQSAPTRFSAQVGTVGASVSGLVVGTAGRGSGELHGSGFFQARESGWAAVNPFAVVTTYRAGAATAALARPADSVLLFGGALGRMVRVPGLGSGDWGRVGLFGAVEAREQQQVLYSTPQTAAFFALSATQRALLANRGVSVAATTAALSYLSGLGGPATLWGSQVRGRGRVELAPSGRDQVSLGAQLQRVDAPATGGAQVAEGVVSRAVGSVGTATVRAEAASVQWTHVFGPRWINLLRVGVGRDLESEAPGPGSADVPGVGPGGLAPQVAIAPQGFSYGTTASLGRVAYPDEGRVDVTDTAAWRFGRHVLTVGGGWSRADDRVLGATNQEGSFLYDSGTTGGHAGGLVDWISDYTFNVHAYPNGACPSVSAGVHYFCFRSYSQSFANAEAEFETHEMAGFAEDALRLGRRLRVTLGARWEYQLLPMPLLPNRTLDEALAMAGAEGSMAYGRTTSFPEDRNNVGPRVAVSWAPGGHGAATPWVTVQAAYGIFFGRLPGATLNAALTETGVAQATTRIRILPSVETGCPQMAGQGFGFPCAFAYAPLGVAPVAQTASVVVFAERFRLPVVQRASLVVERAVGQQVVMRASYAGAWATQLPETTDLNIAPSTRNISYVVQGGDRWPGMWTGQSFQVPLYTARRTTKYGPVTAIESNANATYHSGTVEAVLRGWHGWSGRGSFTFSRAIDYGPQVGPTPRQDGQFDPYANGYDKGRSSLDRPWGVGGAVVYRSRWESGAEWGRRLLGGWTVEALGRAGSGAPYSYTIFGGTRLQGGHESINGSGGATYLPTVGRNTLRLPMRSRMDVRTGKEVRLGRGAGQEWRLELRADASNVLNTVSLSRVETRAFLLGTQGSVGGMTPLLFQDAATVTSEGVSTPAFGAPLSSTTGLSRERTVELGARLMF